jgi:hypothetical protein
VVPVIFTAGLKEKHRKHYSNDAEEIIRNVHKNLLESGCKVVGKETARLTGVNETTVSKIWNRNPENLERKKRESKDSNYSAAELDAIRDIIYQVIPKLLFKNNNKKVSVRTQQKAIFTIYLMFVPP